ncbi:MAG: hypothetical protein ABL940_06075, partial [Bacteroidia bacterium]
MLNNNNWELDNVYLQVVVDYHKTNVTFQKRPITTMLIETVQHVCSIPIGISFVLVNFSLLFISGLLVYKLSTFFKQTNLICAINTAVYFMCFSNVFMFFSPIYSYDEPLQYTFVFLSLLLFLKQNWIGYIITFSVAI